jgi:hypothetical protein
MTNTVFPMNQTQYILDFLSASHSGTHWDLPNTEIFHSKGVSSGWQIPVFRYSLLMRKARGYIEFETLEKQCWSYLRTIRCSNKLFFFTNVLHIIYPYFSWEKFG